MLDGYDLGNENLALKSETDFSKTSQNLYMTQVDLDITLTTEKSHFPRAKIW